MCFQAALGNVQKWKPIPGKGPCPTHIFKKKRNVPFAALEQIDEELDRLENVCFLFKTDFSEWAAPKVYVR